VDQLERLLVDLTGGNDALAEAAVAGLARLGPLALDPLILISHSPDPDRRWWAVRCLAELDLPASRACLRAALHDDAASVRECAALGLRQSPSTEAIPDLTWALNSRDLLLVRLAADALAACGPTAIPALADAALSSNPAIRIEAVRALASTNDPGAIPALFRALEDRSTLVGHWAEQGLDRLGMGMVYFRP
jgi:HEAT repeat protein